MTTQAIQQDETVSDFVDESGIDPTYRLPDDIRDSLTNHFLALMGAEPLRPEERLAA